MLAHKIKHLATMAAAAAAVATAAAAPVQWTVASGGNGHWYDYVVPASTVLTGFNWNGAFAHAPTQSFNGMTGYMATVTSQAEQDFIFANVTQQTAWLGGNDRDTEGTWVWQNGPEAGQVFFIAGAGAQPGFSYWNANEPNDCCNGGEDDLQINWNTATGQWNDHGTPSSPDNLWGYIVEYSEAPTGVPEPASMLLAGSALLALGLRRRRTAG